VFPDNAPTDHNGRNRAAWFSSHNVLRFTISAFVQRFRRIFSPPSCHTPNLAKMDAWIEDRCEELRDLSIVNLIVSMYGLIPENCAVAGLT
jgi:hypothetical protein